MTTRRELIQAAHDNWNANRDVDAETMRDLGYDTPESLPDTVERVLGEEAAGHTAQIELVTDSHTPRTGARRAAKLRERPAARTAREKAARDQAQGLEHKTPPEWSPRLFKL